jgi:hypothetical protein
MLVFHAFLRGLRRPFGASLLAAHLSIARTGVAFQVGVAGSVHGDGRRRVPEVFTAAKIASVDQGRRPGKRGIDLCEEGVVTTTRARAGSLKGAGRCRQAGRGGPGHIDVPGAVVDRGSSRSGAGEAGAGSGTEDGGAAASVAVMTGLPVRPCGRAAAAGCNVFLGLSFRERLARTIAGRPRRG